MFSGKGFGILPIMKHPRWMTYTLLAAAAYNALWGFFQSGRLGQLFGLSSWTRGFQAGLLRRHGIGWLEGDGFLPLDSKHIRSR
jgi:hypothetical protein